MANARNLYRRFIFASLSWLLSLLASMVPVLIAAVIVGQFASSNTAGIAGWAVLLFGVVPWWIWTKRRYGRLPLFRLIPLEKGELEQFREWRDNRQPPDGPPPDAR